MKNTAFILIITSLVFIMSCGEDPIVKGDMDIMQDTTPYVLDYGGLPTPDLPEDNELTQSGVELGRMLFYEPMLSKDNSMSCATCHRQEDGFSDTLQFSIGVRGLPGGRQAMSVFNMAWNDNEFFWDGRAHLLRDQSLKPIQDMLEMDETLENVVGKLSGSQLYRDQFIRVFGSNEVTEEKVSLALEQFMISITSYRSKYDKWLEGSATLSESEERGRELFFAEYNPFFPESSGADCAHCHGGSNFENDQYLNNGLDSDAMISDLGREIVTGLIDDKAKFKVPSLRNVELTPPYMHDGRFKTLEEVVNHYNEGIKESSTLDVTLRNTLETGLLLTDTDKKDLVNFLKTLTDHELGKDERFSSPF